MHSRPGHRSRERRCAHVTSRIVRRFLPIRTGAGERISLRCASAQEAHRFGYEQDVTPPEPVPGEYALFERGLRRRTPTTSRPPDRCELFTPLIDVQGFGYQCSPKTSMPTWRATTSAASVGRARPVAKACARSRARASSRRMRASAAIMPQAVWTSG